MTSLLRRLAALLPLLLGLTAAANADDAVFPPGSRLGLAPPPGFVVARNFAGFEDREKDAAILLVELPGALYDNFVDSMRKADSGGPGVTGAKREVLLTQSGAAYLIAADQEAAGTRFRKWLLLTLPTDAYARNYDVAYLVTVQVPERFKGSYSEAAIRAALATLATREVPKEEILGLLPFKLGELAGFRVVRSVTPRLAILLSDQEEIAAKAVRQPHLLVSVGAGAPVELSDREHFARQLLANMQGFKDLRVVASEPMRISGQPGFEIRLAGKEEQTGADMMLVQWVRFGSEGFLRLVGIAPKEQWADAFTRFRAVRDGIDRR